MKHKAMLWEKLNDNKVKCHVCANECTILPGKVGICRTRQNIDGELFTLTYGSMISRGSVDPIEKKPLYNYWPGHSAYSIASIGCSFKCRNCQNWSISQAIPNENGDKGFYEFEDYKDRKISLIEMAPEDLVKRVVNSGAKTLAYTYNEPLIWHEWIMDTGPLLHEKGIKTILVTNGFSTPEASKELIDIGIGAANIDIKGMTDEFYQKICAAPSVQPVLDTAKRFKEGGIHVETTNLIIPDWNDDEDDIRTLCEWVYNNLGDDTPLHFSAYHPDYKKPSNKRTSLNILDKAYNIAKDTGLNFPYVGNIRHEKGSKTFCPNCGEILIERHGFNLSKIKITKDKKCGNCSYDLSKDIIGEINRDSRSSQFSFF